MRLLAAAEKGSEPVHLWRSTSRNDDRNSRTEKWEDRGRRSSLEAGIRALSCSLAIVSLPWDPGNGLPAVTGRCLLPESGSTRPCTLIARSRQGIFRHRAG